MTEPLKPPIFLLGNVRSGTSMMHDFFDGHPQVKAWYEPRTIWVYADPTRLHDRFEAVDATPRVIRYIRGRFLKFQRHHGNKRIMEKTPSNLLRIPYVHAIFPESKYLYMVREPLAYLSSSEIKWQTAIGIEQTLKRLWESPTTQLHHYLGRFVRDKFTKHVLRSKYVSIWGVRYPGILADLANLPTEHVIARQWAHCSMQAEADLARIDPALVLRMRYEDFVADPVQRFEQICDHFELGLTAKLAKHIAKTVDPTRQRKWQRMDLDRLAKCLPIVEREMKRHGYAVPQELQTPPDFQ